MLKEIKATYKLNIKELFQS